jgi:transposase
MRTCRRSAVRSETRCFAEVFRRKGSTARPASVPSPRTAYYLKEDLRQIWSQPNKRTARQVFGDWRARARASGIAMLMQLADTLASYQEGILAYYDYPISTGPLEGTNTKIQVMKRQAYGFRDREFFKLKILGIHETKHALVG